MMKGLRKSVFPALMLAGSAPTAQAQSIAPDEQVDRALDTLDRFDRDTSDAAFGVFALDAGQPVWELKFSLPATFTSNALTANADERSSLHFAPAIQVSRTWKIGQSAALTLGGSAFTDAYTAVTEADQSVLGFSATVDIGDPEKELAISLGYKPQILYSGQFDAHVVTLHRFSAGLSRTYALGPAEKLVLNGGIERREATKPGAEQFRYSADATFKSAIDEMLSWQLGATLSRSDYTGGTNDGRDDTKLAVNAALGILLRPAMKLTVGMDFTRNWSDFAGKDYSVFDAGPKLTLTSKF